MAPQLPADFSEFLRLLHAHRVKYLLIGGYAVAHYGYVRTTADMDVWIEASAANAARVCKALAEFGFEVDKLNRELFLNPRNVIRMGVPPLRLEISMSIDGVDFKECYARKRRVRFQKQSVKVIDLHDLIKNKKASGREKDLLDIRELQKAQRKRRPSK